MDENYFSIMADDYDFRTLGIIEVGTFNSDGFPKDFEVANEILRNRPAGVVEVEHARAVNHAIGVLLVVGNLVEVF